MAEDQGDAGTADLDLSFSKGTLNVRRAQTAPDLAALQALRAQVFRAGHPDHDAFDAQACHVIIEDASGLLLAGFRLLLIEDAAALHSCYSAQSYDLAPLAQLDVAMLELGRFCVRPGLRDPDVMRLAWAAITRFGEARGVGLLFGCTSFAGADWHAHQGAFAHLARYAIGPAALRPRPKAREHIALNASTSIDSAATLPPLLRSYLGMGGWTSDHAVIDRDLDTCHVFTALEPGKIPAPRLKALRNLSA
jgi:putative hemolysin